MRLLRSPADRSGGNLVLAWDQHRRLDQALEPAAYVEPIHEAGALVLHTVGSAEEAWRAGGCGVDVIVAQGWEAGWREYPVGDARATFRSG